MIKTDRFLASQALYAVDLSSLSSVEVGKVQLSGAPLYRYEIKATWFKRRKGLDTANIGVLWDITTDRYENWNPAEAVTFLVHSLTDGRFGGDLRSRWDGERLWSTPDIKVITQAEDLHFLIPMLNSYPAIPEGYDGWWRFAK